MWGSAWTGPAHTAELLTFCDFGGCYVQTVEQPSSVNQVGFICYLLKKSFLAIVWNQHVAMSTSLRLQVVITSKEFATKY